MVNIQAILAIAGIIANLVAQGRTTWGNIRSALSTLGATQEELQALDAKLTTAIEEREAEHGRRPAG